MSQSELDAFVARAEEVYESRLRESLEDKHRDKFVAIEPDSGKFYLGQTLSEAMSAAHEAHPNRLAHAMRVGHATAIHFGASIR